MSNPLAVILAELDAPVIEAAAAILQEHERRVTVILVEREAVIGAALNGEVV